MSGRNLQTVRPTASSLEPPTSTLTVHHNAPAGLGCDSEPHRQPNAIELTTPYPKPSAASGADADDLEQDDLDLLLQSLDEDALLYQEYSRSLGACSTHDVSLIILVY